MQISIEYFIKRKANIIYITFDKYRIDEKSPLIGVFLFWFCP